MLSRRPWELVGVISHGDSGRGQVRSLRSTGTESLAGGRSWAGGVPESRFVVPPAFDGDARFLIEQAVRAVERADGDGVPLRLVGGIAVALHCPSAASSELRRSYANIDFVAGVKDGAKLDAIFSELDYRPDKRFNSLNGQFRRLYLGANEDRQIDVFLRDFRMCHELPLGERLDIDAPTVPLAELFLTKAQIVELNHKDVIDLFALLADHPVGAGDDDTINGERVATLCAKDWGLWRTVTWTLDRLEAILASDLGGLDVEPIRRGIDDLRDQIAGTAKSMRWKARARVGDRVRWFEVPDDPKRKVD